jgi:hypothetical protein
MAALLRFAHSRFEHEAAGGADEDVRSSDVGRDLGCFIDEDRIEEGQFGGVRVGAGVDVPVKDLVSV